jgi:hypothetical protein
MKFNNRMALSLTLVLSSAGACSGPQPGALERPRANVVFQAAYSKGGELRLTEDDEGVLGMSVTGTTGVDDPGAVTGKIKRSLVATHRALLPDVPVPAELVRLDQRYLAQFTGRAKLPVDARARQEAAARASASLSRSLSPGRLLRGVASAAEDFANEFCRYRWDNGISSYPTDCWYFPQTDYICYFIYWPWQGVDSFPASFAKNDGPSGASLWGPNALVSVNAGQWAFAAFSPRNGELVCFDYEGSIGSAGLTAAIAQFDN